MKSEMESNFLKIILVRRGEVPIQHTYTHTNCYASCLAFFGEEKKGNINNYKYCTDIQWLYKESVRTEPARSQCPLNCFSIIIPVGQIRCKKAGTSSRNGTCFSYYTVKIQFDLVFAFHHRPLKIRQYSN